MEAPKKIEGMNLYTHPSVPEGWIVPLWWFTGPRPCLAQLDRMGAEDDAR